LCSFPFFPGLSRTLRRSGCEHGVLAIYILLFQGGMVAGSTLWGIIADRWSIGTALLCAGIGAIAATALGLIWNVPDAPATLRLGKPWPMPLPIEEPGFRDGPVPITVEYWVQVEKEAEFLEIMGECERARRRDGGGVSFAICRPLIAVSKRFSCVPGRSTCASMRGKPLRTTRLRSGYEAVLIASRKWNT